MFDLAVPRFFRLKQRNRSCRIIILALCCVYAIHGYAQQSASTQASAQDEQQSAQTVKPVTTTVVVTGQAPDDYLPQENSVGSLDNLPLAETPITVTVMTRDLLNDQVSRLLSDVVKNDASVGEDYAPVGYYGDYQIRGFTIDLATGFQINGMPVAGEQDVPLENKQSVEILKGIAGIESGVTTAGGLFNYVTKRPAVVKTVELATDHRGTAFADLDLGALFGAQKQFGVRTNMAGEDIHTYVESANGWRGLGTLSTDWKISPVAMLKTDFEYQHKRERSVAGYQLLGGDEVPSLSSVFPSVMLGNQIWSKPNIFDAINTDARLDLDVTPIWHVYEQANYSHSLIDDDVIYPYGCYYEAACDPTQGGTAPPYFFAPDGTYDIYDYRDPGERRYDSTGEVIAAGRIRTGAIEHNLVFGGSIFHRGVYLPGAPGPDAPDTVQDGAVYTYIGSENIYQSNVIYPIESPVQQAGPLSIADFNHQSAGIVQDRIELPERVRLTAGGRYASVSDFNYASARGIWLPQYSVTWSSVNNLMLYGSYSVLLSLGPQAPFWAINGSAYLAPFFTRQSEIGAKFEPGQKILLSADVFRMRAPFFYPKVISQPDAFCTDVTEVGQCFEADGHETHDGAEITAQGKAASWARLSFSAAGISAVSDDSGTIAFNGKQVINAPKFKTTLFADLAWLSAHAPQWKGFSFADFHLMPGWSYTDRKFATRDDAVSVGGYNLFNIGASYHPGGEQGRVAVHLYADNVLDKRYWKDTGASYGDTFIHLGAPTTVRLSMQYKF
ncbi:TonB-dependent siderophore receptor [Acidicapsa dinghuensis]|uniref:TonB-dependent siderophore receptor n=1 Tax=Acidicapsa dinghuensis TaxID=2218256 RepID=A0ABW1EEX3_9BACT|nr:TonB-dependent receptor [Acidicapsa dinghuensis]